MELQIRIIRKIIRGFKQLFGIWKSCRVCWLPYLKKNPLKIRLFPKWFFTNLFGAPYKNGTPFFSFEAVEWLNKFLTKDMKVFEWGSGGSTIYFSKKVNTLISIEVSPEWHDKVSKVLKKNNITNCQYLLKIPEASDSPNYPSNKLEHKGLDFESYCKTIDEYPNGYFDLIVVDGAVRSFCIRHAFKKIRQGGFLFLDDSEEKRHTDGVEELRGLEGQDFISPKFYTYRCHRVTIWKI